MRTVLNGITVLPVCINSSSSNSVKTERIFLSVSFSVILGNGMTNCPELEFGISCEVTDHSGTLSRVWISHAVVKEMLNGLSPMEYLQTEEDVKTQVCLCVCLALCLGAGVWSSVYMGVCLGRYLSGKVSV